MSLAIIAKHNTTASMTSSRLAGWIVDGHMEDGQAVSYLAWWRRVNVEATFMPIGAAAAVHVVQRVWKALCMYTLSCIYLFMHVEGRNIYGISYTLKLKKVLRNSSPHKGLQCCNRYLESYSKVDSFPLSEEYSYIGLASDFPGICIQPS